MDVQSRTEDSCCGRSNWKVLSDKTCANSSTRDKLLDWLSVGLAMRSARSAAIVPSSLGMLVYNADTSRVYIYIYIYNL